jgi:hypothetical protein
VAHLPADVRREQFIDAAVNVIARVGVDGATTGRIAEEADAPLAAPHYCFQSNENPPCWPWSNISRMRTASTRFKVPRAGVHVAIAIRFGPGVRPRWPEPRQAGPIP